MTTKVKNRVSTSSDGPRRNGRVRLLSPNRNPAWIESVSDLAKRLHKRLDCDRVLIGAVIPQRPRIDEIIYCDGFHLNALQGWLDSGHKNDSVIRSALRAGAAAGTAEEAGWAGPKIAGATPLACFALPEGYPDRRHWLVTVARPNDDFSDSDLRALSMLAREWIAEFNRPRELELRRLLVGNNDRIIHADPGCEVWLNSMDIDLKYMMVELRDIVEQRWPEFQDGQVHDLVFTLGGQPVWICMTRRRAVAQDVAEQWYLELRPLEKGEMLPVGVIEDDRIAQAVGHMHDRYANAPGLNAVSDLVGISPFHFHRLFSKQVGTTPKQYVLLKQIQMAKWMLRAKRVPISVIASETGFASHGHFTSTFRRMQGQSPSEYREQSED